MLLSFRRDTMIDHKNKVIGTINSRIKSCVPFMEHAIDIKCGKMKTPMKHGMMKNI